jgi:quercetin dioxygenase-like cupin family protein
MSVRDRKGSNWVFAKDLEGQTTGAGVVRTILAFCDELMVVRNDFETGAVGAMHSHPHTQITFVVSGKFRFTIGDEQKDVGPGDSLCKQHGIPHGCVCLEAGALLDTFTPMREDFLA